MAETKPKKAPAKKAPAKKAAKKTPAKKKAAAKKQPAAPAADLDPGRLKVDGMPSIGRWCTEAGGSQRELGAKLGVTQSGLQRMLKPKEPRDIRVQQIGSTYTLLEIKRLTG